MRQSINSLLRAQLRDNYWLRQKVDQLTANEQRSPESLRLLQECQLKRTLRAARRRLGAYRDLKVPERDLIQYLQALPSISKLDLLKDRKNYYPNLGLRRLWTAKGLTSGTTGTPLEFHRSLESVGWERAFVQRHWSWSGFAWGMKRATLRGENVVGASQTTGPFWHFKESENQLVLSSRHLRLPYIDAIVRQLRSFDPYLLQAYPSTAFELALYLERIGEQLDIPFVYTSSEVLYPHQREVICARLNARIMDHYGMAERVAFIAECESGNYHVNSDYSFVEILDEEGNPTNEVGYLVGTTFHNAVMPLIRYRLSDRTAWRLGTCPCGRTYPMVQAIEGKFEDTIYGSSGDPVSPSVITFAFKGLKNIEQSQVVQVEDRHWEIRVVPLEGYGEGERRALIRNIRELVDPGLKVTVVEQAEIPRTSSGKFRWVVNEWPARPRSNKRVPAGQTLLHRQ